MNILIRLADRQAEFSETANHLRKHLVNNRLLCFGLSIGGAALAAIAGGLPSDTYRSCLVWPAAVMLAIGTFITGRSLDRDSVKLHVTARMTSEAFKREAFLYATSAPPYDDASKRDAQLKGALDMIEKNAESIGLYEQKAKGPGSCPRQLLDTASYVTSRLDEQISYYRKSAEKLSKPSRFFHRAEFVLVGAGAVITAIAASLGKNSFDIASLTAIITTFAGTIVAHHQAGRYDERIISYRATAQRLAYMKVTVSSRATAAEIALATEEIIAAETKSWQAHWLKESPQ